MTLTTEYVYGPTDEPLARAIAKRLSERNYRVVATGAEHSRDWFIDIAPASQAALRSAREMALAVAVGWLHARKNLARA